jgi:predicted metal-dependent peptidase
MEAIPTTVERLYDEEDRLSIDETFANMFSSPAYREDYVFYAHILAQCKVVMTKDVPLAGVNFTINRYNLFINPDTFLKLPILERMAVLKHEALHILYGHISRKGDRNHELFNITSDCAINQLIKREHLPSGCVFPDSLEKQLKEQGYKIKVPKMLSAENYYDLLPSETKENAENGQCNSGDGEPQDCGECDGTGEDGNGEPCKSCNGTGKEFYKGLFEDNPLDNHSKWDESEGEKDLQQDITKRMIDKSIEKSRGNVPSDLEHFMKLWERKAQISWKKVLRNIASNKKANKVATIMRKSRRFPNRPEIRGHKKDRVFDIVVILDVSGSMSNEEIIVGLNEIREVAKLTASTVKILQVDTEVHAVEDFTPGKFNRSAGGGTEMLPGFRYIKENKISHDAIILITDGWIEDISYWTQKGVAPKCPLMILSTEADIDVSAYRNYRFFKLDQA